ncbi:MFS transporter [Fervidibacillus halotolerans]|uniref:MFS transporter n=1 Tax=Fervidibacillus halotolerans TaxID=2980027 RepID=A0A9E8M1L2_9BACI|nr:MFS transporter [Fervidibacillus halotolerans]WAA13220.1 MFS transporter [Fervidibacillus halotolerans]
MLSLSLFNLISYFAMSVVVAFFPIYFQYKGLNPAEIGWLLAVGTFISVFSQPIWGLIADKKQTIKRIVLLLLVFSLLTSSFIFFADSFSYLFFAMALFFFFFSPVQPLVDSLATAYTIERGKNYGAVRMWGSIGFATSSLVTGIVIEWIGIENIGFILGTFIILTFLISTRLMDRSTKMASISTSLVVQTLKNKEYVFFLFAVFLITFPHRMNDSILGLYLSKLGATEGEIGAAWTIAAASEAPFIFIMALFLKKFHHLQLMAFAGGIYFIRWFLYGMTDHVWTIISLQALHSITFAVFLVASLQYVAVLVPREMLATGQTIFFAVQSGLGGIFGSLIGGYMMKELGAPFTYQVGSLFALAGSLLSFVMYLSRKKRVLQASE